jgi:hypothetical protein
LLFAGELLASTAILVSIFTDIRSATGIIATIAAVPGLLAMMVAAFWMAAIGGARQDREALASKVAAKEKVL